MRWCVQHYYFKSCKQLVCCLSPCGSGHPQTGDTTDSSPVSSQEVHQFKVVTIYVVRKFYWCDDDVRGQEATKEKKNANNTRTTTHMMGPYRQRAAPSFLDISSCISHHAAAAHHTIGERTCQLRLAHTPVESDFSSCFYIIIACCYTNIK